MEPVQLGASLTPVDTEILKLPEESAVLQVFSNDGEYGYVPFQILQVGVRVKYTHYELK